MNPKTASRSPGSFPRPIASPMTTPSPIIMVFGGRISVKYALKRADIARLDRFRSQSLRLVISTTFGCWNKAKKTPGGYAMVRPVLSVKKEPTLLDDLNQALAGETLAAFRYLYLSKIATGISSLPLSKLFKEMADGEWDHASRFMERIIQLGGVPVSKPVEWGKKAFFSYSEPPRRGNDLKAM